MSTGNENDNKNENENEIEIQESPLKGSQGDGGDSSSTCMICMEDWTIVSEHRISCLKCGHLFGRSCIERWIKEKGASAKCPTCNKSARKSDIRDLWCKTIKATDNAELNQLQQLLENERKLRKTDSAVIFHNNLKLEMLHGELDKLKRILIEKDVKIARLEAAIMRYNKMRAQSLASNVGEENALDIIIADSNDCDDSRDHIVVEPRELKGMFHFAEKIESSPTGGCKALALCPTSSVLLVAQPTPHSTRNIFGGFGLRKFSTLDTNIREFIPLHSKEITSIKLKPLSDLILTSSQDRRVKITSISNNACIQSYQSQFEPTCVAWSLHRDQQFYVASANCYVALYDLRNTHDYIYQIDRRIANTRVLSIAATSGAEDLSGLLFNDIKGCQFLEVSSNSDYEQETIDRAQSHLTGHPLPFEGIMGTVDYCKRLDLSLISTRRTPLSPNSTHNLIKLEKVRNDDGGTSVKCKNVRTFCGRGPGELLSQSRILKHPTLEEYALVGATDQGSRGIKIWDSSDNTEYQTIKESEFMRDMVMLSPENTNQHILYTLSEKGLSVYRWDYA